MHLMSSILLAVSSSLDNFGVAIVFGLRKIRLPVSINLLISVMTSLGTFLSMKAGECFFVLLNPVWANYLSSGIMIAAGIWISFQPRIKIGTNGNKWCIAEYEEGDSGNYIPPETVVRLRIKRLGLLVHILREPVSADWNCSGKIDYKEAFVLGLALSLNNIAGGIGGGMAGLYPGLTALLTIATSFIFFVAGGKIGHNFLSKWIGERVAQIAGLILIGIGIYELFV